MKRYEENNHPKPADILSKIPQSAWDSILKNEPEWKFMTGLSKYGNGKLSVLLIAAGLNDFKLKRKAEDGYWPEILKELQIQPLPASPKELFAILEPFYQKELYAGLKITRLSKFLNSSLAHQIWDRPLMATEVKFQAVWHELASVMGQDPEAKTISFAMKCLGLRLVLSGLTHFDYENIPIPVDSRIINFSKKLGLCSNYDPVKIRKVWQEILYSITTINPSVTMLHLDSLIWQIAMIDETNLLAYFDRLEIKHIGQELADYIHNQSGAHGWQAFVNPIVKPVSSVDQNKASMNDDRIICFLPCCGRKSATGLIERPPISLSEIELPHCWSTLEEGRRAMQGNIDWLSRETSAIHLYTGSPFDVISPFKMQIIELIRSGKLQLYIISAGYGVINALEPIHEYDAMMKQGVARHWNEHHLAEVIGELIHIQQPTHVFGFFAGKSDWSPHSSSYRYFFSKGVQVALKLGSNSTSGCFYRASGMGVKEILGAIGSAFTQLVASDFDESFVLNVEQNQLRIGDVVIGFDRLS